MDKPDGFDQVYSEHAAFIFRVVRALGVASGLVKDAVQEVFSIAHPGSAAIDHGRELRTLLFQIAHRVARDYRRKAAGHAAPGHPPAQREQNEELKALSELLDRLDDDNKRIALIMVEIEGMSVPEVAELTGTPPDAMHTRLRRARMAFSAALAGTPAGSEGTELSADARGLLQRSRDALAPDPEELRAVREALRAELGPEALGGAAAEPLAAAAWKLVAIAVLLAAATALYFALRSRSS